MTDQNLEAATELMGVIGAAARAGQSLSLGPQAVKNLQGVLGDLLKRAMTEAKGGRCSCGKYAAASDTYVTDSTGMTHRRNECSPPRTGESHE